MEKTLFPISMEKHIVFCAIAAVFFLLQFIRTKRIYQLILAIAVPVSLLHRKMKRSFTVSALLKRCCWCLRSF